MHPEPTATSHAAHDDQGDGPVDDPHTRRHGMALCLSGGGYRAALFHLGAVRRLDELGILAQLDTVSGVSGGSLVANLLADPRLTYPLAPRSTRPRSPSARPDAAPAPIDAAPPPIHAQEGDRVGGFEELVAEPLRRLTSRNIRTPALLSKLAPWHWFTDGAAARVLADELATAVGWWSVPLRDNAVAGPAIITGATEIAYGVDWVFEDPTAHRPHGRVGDYRLGYAAPPPSLRIADIVAASCAYPPFFAPMVFDGAGMNLTGGHPGLESAQERQRIRRQVRLTDGGVYDNLGLEPVWKSHGTVLVSDGGGVFRARTERTVHGRMLRILGIATSGGQSVRSRWLQAGYHRGVLAGTAWALDTAAEGCYPREVTELINAIRTDLDAFSTQEQQILERHGYMVTEAQVRSHAPELIRRDVPAVPPHPEVADVAVATKALRDSSKRRLLGRR